MNKKIIFGIVYTIALLTIGTISAFAVTYLHSANEFYYSNTESGLESVNVQDAIDEVYSDAVDYSTIEELIYPIGSIYFTVEDDTVAKVQERLGGSWEVFGAGKTLVGVNASDNDFNTVGKTGGSKSHSYTPAGTNSGTAITVAQLPSHNHSYNKPNGTTGSTTLTAAQTGLRQHTHGISKNFNFTIGNAGGSGTSGIHNGSSNWSFNSTNTYGNAHWFTISVDNKSANASQGHTHSMGSTSTNTGNQGSGNTHTHTFTGTAATISHMQPYITVYMYRRVG